MMLSTGSLREISQFERMVDFFFTFLCEYELIDFEACDLARERLEEVFEAMRNGRSAEN